MYNRGWYKVAFERELTGELTPINVGSTRLVLAHTGEGFRVFSATCPHRGAHLGYGGQLDGRSIICPFHSYRIDLGTDSRHGFHIREFPTLAIGGLIFVRLSETHDKGFAEFIQALAEDHVIVPGYTLDIKAPHELVIENGFDNTHFKPVHHVSPDKKFVTRLNEQGSLEAQGTFHLQGVVSIGDRKVQTSVDAPLVLNAFSPGLSVLQIEGPAPYKMITGSTPTLEGHTILRLSLILPIKRYGNPPEQATVDRLLIESKRGIQDDQLIWEHISLTAPHKLTAQDAAILAFQEFCQDFEGEEIT